MPRICYQPRKFSKTSQVIIGLADEIIEDYMDQGYVLTLRQLYYQFVARDYLPNTQQSYKRLGSIINDARLAGLIDWTAIEDRTRSLSSMVHWKTPGAMLNALAGNFHYDKWAPQPCRVEVWIEKEALAGVFERVCRKWDVPFLSCRGYGSQSVMWEAARRIKSRDQPTIILHFGDHDPSGIDMSRDIVERLRLFRADIDFHRMALNMDQVHQYHPPPNPTKLSDSRSSSYVRLYGLESWELDALEPSVLSALVEGEVVGNMDKELWEQEVERELEARDRLFALAEELDD